MSNVEQLVGDLDSGFHRDTLAADAVAWDIETSGLHWEKDSIATCQLALPDGRVRLVRVSPYRAPERLISLLAEPTTRKIFHHAPFDLRFMMAKWGGTPRNIACTKVASKILEPTADPSCHSLKPLLERYLGVAISKAEQTSDWFAPELSRNQLLYAAADVEHLLALEADLARRCEEAGVMTLVRSSWAYMPTRAALDIRGSSDVFAY